MHVRRFAAYVVLLILVGGVLAGCSSTDSDDDADSQDSTGLPDGMGSTAADGKFPRTVKHFGGETKIESEPKRVAILSTGQLDATLSLGIVPVAAARADESGLVPQYLAKAYSEDAEALGKLADVGSRKEVNFEKLAKAKPDLILANEQGFEDEIDRLKQIAPTVLSEGEGVNWEQDLKIVAAALGTAEDADALIEEIDAQAEQVGQKADNQTFSFLRIQDDRNRIFGVGSFPGELAERAGLKRPKSQQFSETSEEISLEKAALIAADWVFFAVPDGKPGQRPPENLTKGLGDRVKPDRLISVNEDIWFLNAGPTAASEVYDDIAEALDNG